MARDINTKKLKKNAFRYSKVRGETASRIRIPGGVINAGSMAKIAEVAEKYGNGTIFVTNRQGVELPGIALEDMDAVNKMIQSIIDDSGVNQEERDKGYPASGTRNVVACPGQRLCPFGCYDTTALARKMDKMIFPSHLHVKIAFTGCSNDCGKVRMDDFGFIGMTEPQYDPDRCVSCEQCIKRQSGAGYRQVHRMRCMRRLLPDPRLDKEQGALFPRCHHGTHRQEESASGRGLRQMGGRGEHLQDGQERLRLCGGVY